MNQINKQLMKKMMTKKQYRKEMQKGRSIVGKNRRLGTRLIVNDRMYSRSAAKREERRMYDKIIEET